MTPPILRATNLRKSFKQRVVVNNVSLEVFSGEIVGLLGPNGAGKSTSFNMVAGLVIPDAGAILLDGEDLAKLPLYKRAQRGLAYLPQNTTVFQGLTVWENFTAVMEGLGFPKEAQDTRAER